MEIKIGQIWQHYKGKQYKILLLGKHSETGEEMIAYEQQETSTIYFRPRELFFQTVEWEGKTVPRFVLISDNKNMPVRRYLYIILALYQLYFILINLTQSFVHNNKIKSTLFLIASIVTIVMTIYEFLIAKNKNTLIIIPLIITMLTSMVWFMMLLGLFL